jgi:hypothetical protein
MDERSYSRSSWVQFIMTAILAAMLGWGATFVGTTWAYGTRISVLEAQRIDERDRLIRIEQKLDRIETILLGRPTNP